MLGFVIAGRVSHVRKGEDPKKFFSYLKSKTSNVSGGPLVRKEGMVTDNREIAEIMNAQYAWVFTREDTIILPERVHLFHLLRLSSRGRRLKRSWKNIKAAGAPGQVKVWSKVLQNMADLLAGPLTTIYSSLMEEAHIQHPGTLSQTGCRRC